MYIGPPEEQEIRKKQAVMAMTTEAEVLLLRAEAEVAKIVQIDTSAEEIIGPNKKGDEWMEWEKTCQTQTEEAARSWQEKRRWWSKVVRPITQPENKAPETTAGKETTSRPSTGAHHQRQRQPYDQHRGDKRENDFTRPRLVGKRGVYDDKGFRHEPLEKGRNNFHQRPIGGPRGDGRRRPDTGRERESDFTRPRPVGKRGVFVDRGFRHQPHERERNNFHQRPMEGPHGDGRRRPDTGMDRRQQFHGRRSQETHGSRRQDRGMYRRFPEDQRGINVRSNTKFTYADVVKSGIESQKYTGEHGWRQVTHKKRSPFHRKKSNYREK